MIGCYWHLRCVTEDARAVECSRWVSDWNFPWVKGEGIGVRMPYARGCWLEQHR